MREGGILRHWLNYLGIWEFIEPENIYGLSEEFRFADNNQTFTFPRTKQELLPSIAEQFGSEHAKIFENFINKIQTILDNSPYTNVNCHDLPSLSFENSQTFINELEKLQLPEILKQMLRARCLLYGVKPEHATLHDYTMVGGLYFDSCHGIYGGGKSLLKACIKALKQHSITIHCNSQVDNIIHQNKKFSHVTLNSGEKIEANTCIFTGHPAQLPHMIDKGIFRPTFYEHIQNIEETTTAFMVFAESNSDYMSNRAVYLLPKDPHACVLNHIEHASPTVYMIASKQINHTNRLPLMIMVPLKEDNFAKLAQPRPKEYLEWKQNKAEFVKQYVEARLPELGSIKVHATATSASIRHWVFGSSGSLYGMAHTTSSIPLLPITRMQGLFLAGQNILLPGILGGIVSAALAVGFATDHKQVLQNFREAVTSVCSAN